VVDPATIRAKLEAARHAPADALRQLVDDLDTLPPDVLSDVLARLAPALEELRGVLEAVDRGPRQ
jgi:hypothetical protein